MSLNSKDHSSQLLGEAMKQEKKKIEEKTNEECWRKGRMLVQKYTRSKDKERLSHTIRKEKRGRRKEWRKVF